MILKEGATKIKSLIYDDIDYGQAGTGTDLPLPGDTGLGTAVAATDIALVDKEQFKDNISCTHIIPVGTATASTLSEYEVKGNSDTDSYNRMLTVALTKGARDQFNMIHTFTVKVLL